jgi:lipopolysaccharide export system protein LptC
MARNIIFGALFFLVMVLALMQTFQEISQQKDRDEAGNNIPDLFLTEATTTRYRENGEVHYTFTSSRINYFKNPEEARATNPDITVYRENGTTVHTTAEKATIVGGGEELHLKGKVKIMQSDRTYQLFSEELSFFPDEEYAETSSNVTISTKSGVTQSLGMTADLKNEKIHLLSNVRGLYANN